MIIQTGLRTDIPAFYSEWFANRLKEGFVMVRNPYDKHRVTRYEIDPRVVDLIGFCTKDPSSMLSKTELLKPYHQYWFVTITPYGPDIEPHVPPISRVLASFRALSEIVGPACVAWRYDPIIINDEWSVKRHIESFERMASALSGCTDTCVISFIDLYDKVKRSYPEVRAVSPEDQLSITSAFVRIGAGFGLKIKPCGESRELERVGADCSGCMTAGTFERAIGSHLKLPPNPNNRRECACYLTGDIGQYNTCGHLCRYCYANSDPELVMRNMRDHDPKSPLLIGHLRADDEVHSAAQTSWVDPQMRLEDFF